MKTQRMYRRSRWMVCLWLLMLVGFAVPDASFALDIYVSVEGGAQADGSLAKPVISKNSSVDKIQRFLNLFRRGCRKSHPRILPSRSNRTS